MAQFINPFPGNLPLRKIDNNELVRALRMNMAAELEATHLYTAHAEATDNQVAKKILLDIADEEKVHMGEFLRLVEMFTGDEGEFLLEGAKEVDFKARGLTNASNTSPHFNPLDPLGLGEAVKQVVADLVSNLPQIAPPRKK